VSAVKNGKTSSGARMFTTVSGTRRVSTSSAGFVPNHFPAFRALLKARTRNWRTWLVVAGASFPSFDCSSSSTCPGWTCSRSFPAMGAPRMWPRMVPSLLWCAAR
jgi:hypothetical protein